MENVETTVQAINAELEPKLGYLPYRIGRNGKLACSACHTERDAEHDELVKTKNVRDSKGDPMTVHVCPGCKYAAGVNISLKKRIDAARKELSLLDFPIGDKFRNDYSRPTTESYFFMGTNPEDPSVKLTDDQLFEAIEEFRESMYAALNPTKVDSVTTTVDPIPAPIDPLAAVEQVAPDTSIPEGSTFNIDEECIETEQFSEESADEGFNDTESSFFEDESDLDDLFGNAGELEADLSSEDEFEAIEEDDEIEEEELEEESAFTPNPILDMDDDSDLDDWFARTPVEETRGDQIAGKHDAAIAANGVTDVKHEGDKLIEDMVKANAEEAEADVFRIDNREHSVASLVRKSRIADLQEIFSDSNGKIVVERIVSLFRKLANRQIKHMVTINDITHECPVVDFEGNIRLIFIDTDIPGGRYDIQSEVNGKLRAPFATSSDFELMTFVIYSDMIERNLMHRVIKAVSKHIAYNLKIEGIFTPISVVTDSDRYFFTTDVQDKDTISNFTKENCAGNVDKPGVGEIAMISQWNNPDVNMEMQYSKEIRNRITIASGGDISYKDLSMRMTCSLRYIMLPQRPDGSIHVTVVDYVEALDLYVRDGFGVLVGAMIYNIKSQFPNSKVHLFYEFDVSMVPSPTISRYLRSGAVRPIIVDKEINQFNKIVTIVANQNNAKVAPIPVEGEIFEAPEYKSPVWRSYNFVPEQRRNNSDNKRVDWRYLGKKSIVKTLGDRFKSYGGVDVSDRKARAALLEKIGMQTIIQPQIAILKITDEFGLAALQKVMSTCAGLFSINQYIRANRSQVVDDNYMTNTGNGQFGVQNTGNLTPEQMMYAQQMKQYQMAMQQQALYAQNMGYGGFQG